ncbi:hypothetical protein BV898_03331 [Hypsibius exemplaris]|uniref:Uncharacterized protein n=1 Tax=Hypsibius exemplaris TaxID=2072580 RepID=A0A1W0X6E8_HYPEX|nr:hypothetical protein BV898_03331 [Hypsibius exemplaris]
MASFKVTLAVMAILLAILLLTVVSAESNQGLAHLLSSRTKRDGGGGSYYGRGYGMGMGMMGLGGLGGLGGGLGGFRGGYLYG